MSEIVSLRCPNCGARLDNPTRQHAVCRFCASEFLVAAAVSDNKTETEHGLDWQRIRTDAAALLRTGRKVQAIQLVRERTHLGVADAKEYVESLTDDPASAGSGSVPTARRGFVWVAATLLLAGTILALNLPSIIGALAGEPSAKRVTSLGAVHKEVIEAALRDSGFPLPRSMEINDLGYLVATFELDSFAPRQTPGQFAEDALLIIRNTRPGVEKFRVTVNGPSPGPGLTRRYGSARFQEGGELVWESAK